MSARFPQLRLRRLRHTAGLRRLVSETQLTLNDLVLPLFIRHGTNVQNPIESLPGHYQLSVDTLPEEINNILKLNLPAVMLFGLPEKKDSRGDVALTDNGVVQRAVREIKKLTPDLVVMVDLCFCEYTDHGHCGIIKNNDVDNDATLSQLQKQAVSLAKAGADVIAPSGMMDGMVAAIRSALDAAGFTHIPILSYAVKYASAFYGAFRGAADCTPQFGDRKTYQMNPANIGEALREAEQDVLEGADMLMVKPAHTYLDVISAVKQAHPGIPVAAYHVSSEYAMLKAAGERGWLDADTAAREVLTSIKRAGADFIITYSAKDVAAHLR